MHSKFDVPKKSKRLINYNDGVKYRKFDSICLFDLVVISAVSVRRDLKDVERFRCCV